MIANLKFLFRTILFLLRTGHLPRTYRKLFQDISSCYLTPDAPGRAKVAGFDTRCTTNRQRMTMLIGGSEFFSINRQAMTVREGVNPDELPLWNAKVRPLKRVFDYMIRDGIPYGLSWTGGYRESDTHFVEAES